MYDEGLREKPSFLSDDSADRGGGSRQGKKTRNVPLEEPVGLETLHVDCIIGGLDAVKEPA